MTTVLRRGRLRIASYREAMKQHHLPHCHIYLAEAEAVFDLTECVCIANNGFKRRALGQIKTIVEEHREEFMDIWRFLNEKEN